MMNQTGDFSSEISRYLFRIDSRSRVGSERELRTIFMYRSWVDIEMVRGAVEDMRVEA